MTWQQIYVLAAMVLRLTFDVWAFARDTESSSTTNAIAIVLRIGLLVAMAFVLHSGGFW